MKAFLNNVLRCRPWCLKGHGEVRVEEGAKAPVGMNIRHLGGSGGWLYTDLYGFEVGPGKEKI